MARSKISRSLEPTMTAIGLKKNRTCALGITVESGVVELYGVNQLNEVVLHGWFDREAAFAIVRDRPACLVAAEEGVLPKEFITLLETLGHSVVIIPSSPESLKSLYKRQAKDCCDMAMGWISSSGQAIHQTYPATRLQYA